MILFLFDFLYANIIRQNVKHVQVRASLHGGFAILTRKT